MNIAFVSSGNSIHVQKLANGLVKNGHSVTLYTLPNHTKLLNRFDGRVEINLLKFGGKLGYYLNMPLLTRMLKKGNYDLVNCHYVSGYGTLARLTHVQPLVASVFGSDVYDYPFKSKSNMKKIIKNLDAAKVITSTSQVMANKVKEYYDTPKPIYVTPFGVDTSIFKPHKKNMDSTIFTFGIVKKLEDKYGIGLLIEAFAKFLESVDVKSKYRLMIYGRGSQEAKYKELAKELEVKDYVFFEGFIQNELVPEALSQMDVGVLPSQIDSESFGVSAVEAMACGVPLIVSDASGFTEVVEDKVCGFIVPKSDKEALVEMMKHVVSMDKKELTSMGQNGYQRVHNLYDFEDNIITYIDAISHAITRRED